MKMLPASDEWRWLKWPVEGIGEVWGASNDDDSLFVYALGDDIRIEERIDGPPRTMRTTVAVPMEVTEAVWERHQARLEW